MEDQTDGNCCHRKASHWVCTIFEQYNQCCCQLQVTEQNRCHPQQVYLVVYRCFILFIAFPASRVVANFLTRVHSQQHKQSEADCPSYGHWNIGGRLTHFLANTSRRVRAWGTRRQTLRLVQKVRTNARSACSERAKTGLTRGSAACKLTLSANHHCTCLTNITDRWRETGITIGMTVKTNSIRLILPITTNRTTITTAQPKTRSTTRAISIQRTYAGLAGRVAIDAWGTLCKSVRRTAGITLCIVEVYESSICGVETSSAGRAWTLVACAALVFWGNSGRSGGTRSESLS